MALLDIIVTGLITLAAVFLGWILTQASIKRPKLTIDFEGGKPCIWGNMIRFTVTNSGPVEAKNCQVKLRVYDKNGKLLIDPLVLHWNKNSPVDSDGTISEGSLYLYHPVTISSNDEENVDFLDLIENSWEPSPRYFWAVHAYPYGIDRQTSPFDFMELGKLRNNESRPVRVEATAYADSVRPSSLVFYYSSREEELLIGRSKEEMNPLPHC